MLGALIQPSPSTSPAAAMRSHSRPTCSSPPLESCTISTNGCHRRSASLYEALRVKHTATQSEIKTAYRSLAKVYHPDTIIRSPVSETDQEDGAIHPGGKGREFMEIHKSYATLSDPAARAVYDLTMGFGGRRQHRHEHGILGRVCCRSTRRWETDQCW